MTSFSPEVLQLTVEEFCCWNDRCFDFEAIIISAERKVKGQQTFSREVETPWTVVTQKTLPEAQRTQGIESKT